jgi:starch-binding outer membrane protein, SusD/RagB family
MKMTRIKLSLAAALVLIAGITTGCDSLLEAEPQQSVSPEIALGSPEGIRAVYHSVYNRITHFNYYGRQLVITGDALADNGVSHPSTSGRFVNEPVNAMGTGVGGWNRYLQINEINLVIKYGPDAGLSAGERDRIMGEMYFHRALAYHDLAKVYAYEPNKVIKGWSEGVILRTEPSETVEIADQFLPRASVTEVYQQIESDLLAAIGHFQQSNGRSRFYANLAAAEALLARVYLYWERWGDAETYATRAMASGEAFGANLATAADVPTMYNSGSAPMSESLFELKYTLSEGQGVNESMQSLITPPGHYDLIPSDEFLATFEEDDVRNELFPLDTDVYPSEGTGHRFVAKYLSTAATPWVDNVPIIRYAEALLTRAEARAEQGNAAGATADLNRLRENRGLAAIQPAAGNLVAEILAERRRELAFEGHRWHDLKRRGMDIAKPVRAGGGTLAYDAVQRLPPVPQTQVDLNPNLNQNPGY